MFNNLVDIIVVDAREDKCRSGNAMMIEEQLG